MPDEMAGRMPIAAGDLGRVQQVPARASSTEHLRHRESQERLFKTETTQEPGRMADQGDPKRREVEPAQP
jgi:hypothetical protein